MTKKPCRKISGDQEPEPETLKILHVIRGLANSSGTTHIVNPLAEAQARLGHSVRVLYVDKPPMSAVLPDPVLVESMGFARFLPLDNPGLSIGLARVMPGHVDWADVIHVHAIWNFPTFWAMRCADRAGKPYMVAPQGSFDPWAMRQNALGKRIYGALTELPLLRRATCMQALSAKEAAQFRAGGLNGPVEIIPNGIAAGMFDDAAARGSLATSLGLPAGSRTLLFLSRVHPKKGLDLLLRAFAAVADRFSDVYLVVAGHDAGSGYKAQMEALAGELGIAERCRFIGEVAGEVKRDCLMSADAWALISHSEGLPVAAVEALGAGLPCVLSDECNLPEVAENDAGWVVKPDADAAAEALTELLGDPLLTAARGKRARQLVAERFTWDRIAARTVEVYAGLVG
jgi:poly(glycerol-phosphate) alpha-glucosyltransferase